MVTRQRVLRSVDSEQMGRVIEPRKGQVAGVDDFYQSEDNTLLGAKWRAKRGPAGVSESGARLQGFPGNLGEPVDST